MEIIKLLQSFANPILDTLFTIITIFGEDIFYTIVLCLIFWCINKKLGYKLGLSLFFSVTVNSAIKEIVNTPRPIGVEGIVSKRVKTATGMSFPSGHTQGVTTFWGALSLHFKKRWLYISSSILIILVGISRLYLGVHWPSDVVGGIVIGIICVILADYFYKKDNPVLLVILGVVFLGLLFLLDSSNYIKTASMFIGFISGLILEKRFINFSVSAPIYLQILKFIMGIAGILLIKEGFKCFLPQNNFGDFIRYFSISFWAIAIYPFIFTQVKNIKQK